MSSTAATTLQRARLLVLIAGAVDVLSGCGLMLQPRLTLRVMLLPVPAEEALVYVRFVGAFVAAVGASYLLSLAGAWWASVRKRSDRQIRSLRAVLAFTLPFRLGAGTFCLVGVVQGWLPFMWIMVTVADYVLIVLQLWLLASRWQEDEEQPGTEVRDEKA